MALGAVHNPFEEPVSERQSLGFRYCQRIYGDALYSLAHGDDNEAPSELLKTDWRALCRRYGSEAIFPFPEEVEKLSEEVTYSYSAVWAICTRLAPKRALAVRALQRQMPVKWEISIWNPSIQIRDSAGTVRAPLIMFLTTPMSNPIQSFRVSAPKNLDETILLTLYDAILMERSSATPSAGGIRWRVSLQLGMPRIFPALSQACAALGIHVEPNDESSELGSTQAEWEKSYQGEVFTEAKLIRSLDLFFTRKFSSVPYRKESVREEYQKRWKHNVALNRDPAQQFPLLRALLRFRSGFVQPPGEVECEGLHYADPLLAYWMDKEVTVKLSETSEPRAWVYVGDDVLCEAMARECLRRDGSYMPKPIG